MNWLTMNQDVPVTPPTLSRRLPARKARAENFTEVASEDEQEEEEQEVVDQDGSEQFFAASEGEA